MSAQSPDSGNAAAAFPIAASLPLTACALRPMHIDAQEQATHYAASTFSPSPYKGCEMIVRRMECFGLVTKPADGSLQGTWFLDVLDAQGDILDTLEVSARGVSYLRRVIGLSPE